MEVVQDPVGFFTSLDDWTSPHPEDYGNEDSQEPFGSVSQSSETYTVGFVVVNIVGIQHYSGTISGQEMVVLVREPLNPNGQNAIKVLNTRAIQVGYIDESAAKVLAPLIDNNLISVEGIVPNLPRTGNLYKIPVRILILTNQEAFVQVKCAILMGGLQLIPSNDAPFTFSEAVFVNEPKAVLMKEPKTTIMEGRTWDEIFKLVYENVSKKSAMKALEPPKGVIKSELFLHQKEGLGWLIHRENPCELPTFWEEKRGGAYINVLTNCRTDRRPEPLQGGIFADDMGLGKTLTLLSLIAFDKCGKEAKKGRESENDSDTGKKRKTEDTHLDKMVEGKPVGQLDDGSGLKSTLIVCPPSVISTWVAQLGEHTRAGSFKTYLYYGVRTQDAEELKKHDIVLTTYGTLASEEALQSETPVKKIEWWRIILDEGHVIKNVNAKQSIAVTNLNAKRRWVVTGTPIQNGSWDLFSLMAFLRFKPFSNPSYWNCLVQRPLAEGNEKGLLRLQGLLASISLRRTKEKTLIGLPRKTIETCFVELSAEQRDLYDQKENEAKSFVRNYIHPNSLTINYSTVLGIILRLRQICADLALCTSDPIFPSTNIEDVSKNPELLRKMVSFLQDGEDLDCPICISPPSDIVISRCAHVFCRSCILRSLNLSKHSCPLCRRKLSESDLFSSPPESSDTDNSEVSPSSTSSKVPALLKLLSATRDQNPAKKSVVFSQFPKMLILIGEVLKANGFKILRLDGSMNAKRRGRVIQEFGLLAPDGPTVLLASLKTAGTGINLTSASTVYLLEPWWNPAVEDQAMDRVHRLGQKEDVKIVRMIAQNSIEERILELQEKRRKIASGRKGRKDKKEMSIDDLRTLLPL